MSKCIRGPQPVFEGVSVPLHTALHETSDGPSVETEVLGDAFRRGCIIWYGGELEGVGIMPEDGRHAGFEEPDWFRGHVAETSKTFERDNRREEDNYYDERK